MGKRRDAREQIEAKIVELGRRQLLDHGAAGLSLRAIARNLGMVSSAVYRYVSSRDELLTLLLVDAYSDLADTVDRARDDTVADSWSDDVIARFLVITRRLTVPRASPPAWSERSSTRSPRESPPETSG